MNDWVKLEVIGDRDTLLPDTAQLLEAAETLIERMPQLRKPVIKERSARLRAAGDARVKAHLAEQVGRTHAILMESPTMGRTEGFTAVLFAEEQLESRIVQATIIGCSATQLTA